MCKEGTEAKILRNPEHSLFLFLVQSLKIFEDSKSFVIFMFFFLFSFFSSTRNRTQNLVQAQQVSCHWTPAPTLLLESMNNPRSSNMK